MLNSLLFTIPAIRTVVLRALSGGPWPFTGSSVPLFSAHLLLAAYKLLIPTTLLTRSTPVYFVCPPKIIDGFYFGDFLFPAPSLKVRVRGTS